MAVRIEQSNEKMSIESTKETVKLKVQKLDFDFYWTSL